MQNLSRDPILDKKEIWVKFQENMIIKGETMNGKKILGCTRDM
jgi:hypothetical protein